MCPVGTLVFPASEMGLDGKARGEDGLPEKGVDLLVPNLCGSRLLGPSTGHREGNSPGQVFPRSSCRRSPGPAECPP